MTRRPLLLAIVTAAILVPAAPAAAQEPSLVGTWQGTAGRDADGDAQKVFVRLRFTSVTVGERVGRSQYGRGDKRCRGRLILKARVKGGYAIRDRRTSGPPSNCTDGDRLFVRLVEPDRLRVRIRPAGTGLTIRFTLKRVA